jgi:hypothetical protein
MTLRDFRGLMQEIIREASTGMDEAAGAARPTRWHTHERN